MHRLIALPLSEVVRGSLKIASYIIGQTAYLNVLFLRFENIKVHPKATLAQISRHLGITLTPEQLERIPWQTSSEAMKDHIEKFYSVQQVIWSTNGRKIHGLNDVGCYMSLYGPKYNMEKNSNENS